MVERSMMAGCCELFSTQRWRLVAERGMRSLRVVVLDPDATLISTQKRFAARLY